MQVDDLVSWANNPMAVIVVPGLMVFVAVVFFWIRREWRRLRRQGWRLF